LTPDAYRALRGLGSPAALKFGEQKAEMLSYTTNKEAAADRDMQRGLLVALDVSKRSLHRDECGAWQIKGSDRGHIYTWGPSGGWLLYGAPGTPRKWNNVKRLLSFCHLTQDGDDEGCLRLLDLPTPEQAVLIRKAIGLKRRKLHPGNLSHLKLTTARRGVSASPASTIGKGGIMADLEAVEQKTGLNATASKVAE
jgi:hypothetical protein